MRTRVEIKADFFVSINRRISDAICAATKCATVTGISNSVTFLQRWMLGWLSDNQVSCLLPTEAPMTLNLSPVIEDSSLNKGIIIPLSEYESILI